MIALMTKINRIPLQNDDLPQEEQLLRGIVKRVVFYNPANGYTVIQLRVSRHDQPVSVVGTCTSIKEGAHLIVRGTFQKHPKFGVQLKADSITETVPSSARGIENYLASGIIKGIGPKTAERLVKSFGADALEIVARDPERAVKASGIGKKKAELLSQALNQQRAMEEVVQFLIEHQVSPRLAGQIFDRYKNRALEILSRDPYLLARQLRGVGFLTADQIARQLGLAPDAPQRLMAGLYYALEKSAEEGHCYLPKEVLAQKARSLLNLPTDLTLDPHLDALMQEGFVSTDEDNIALHHLEKAELFVAQFIARRLASLGVIKQISDRVVANSIELAERELQLSLSPEQQEAVQAASKNGLLLITGGPGCGKTTIIRALTIMFKTAGLRLALAAPTGRAAQRMAQVCDHPASTIHRLLRYNPKTHGFVHGINQPLEADAVIIDETSMLDIVLAKDLFSAIPRQTRLILVGDRDQLPSVGPGRVFADILEISEVRTIALSKLFRRADASSITSVAMQINSGVLPDIAEPDGRTRADAYFINRSDAEQCATLVEALVADQIPRKFGINPQDIMVLTPSNRGPLGTVALNKLLQARLNPPGRFDREQEVDLEGVALRVGDRVCQRVNNYQIDPEGPGVFNGDPGVVEAIDKQTKTVTVKMWDQRLIKYSFDSLSQLTLAYAISVHRSQGSEIPCVVLALHSSHYMLLERQLVYTAVTRAKKLLIIVGQKRSLMLACKRTSGKARYCRLRQLASEISAKRRS